MAGHLSHGACVWQCLESCIRDYKVVRIYHKQLHMPNLFRTKVLYETGKADAISFSSALAANLQPNAMAGVKPDYRIREQSNLMSHPGEAYSRRSARKVKLMRWRSLSIRRKPLSPSFFRSPASSKKPNRMNRSRK